MKAKHEIQKSSQSLSMVAKEKEELTREKANLVTSLTASEREVRQQNEVISAYKSDKDALERSLWELNQANNKLENAKASLESEKSDLQQKVDSLVADLSRTQKEMEIEIGRKEREKEQLSAYMQQMEKDHKVALKNEQEQHHEDVDRLVREKVKNWVLLKVVS